jgi:hypothetical protein
MRVPVVMEEGSMAVGVVKVKPRPLLAASC